MGHDGGQDGFTTSLILFPETRTGVFMSLFSYIGIPDDWNLSSVIDFVNRNRHHDLAGTQTEVEVRFAETFLPRRTALAPRLSRSRRRDRSRVPGGHLREHANARLRRDAAE